MKFALAANALGDIEKAAHLYEIGLRDYPDNTRMLNDLGVIDASLGNYRKGTELFRETIRLDPSSATFAAKHCSLQGMANALPPEFQKLLDHPGMTLNYPLGSFAKLGLTRSLAQKKEFAKARDAYENLFQVWQSADRDLKILNEAKTEFAKLPVQ